MTPEGQKRIEKLIAEMRGHVSHPDVLPDSGGKWCMLSPSLVKSWADMLALLLADALPHVIETKEDTDTRGGYLQYGAPLATAANNVLVTTTARFIPKRACEGAATIDHGDMRECPHPDCRVSIAWDVVDNPFLGFKAGCPLRQPSSAVLPRSAAQEEEQTENATRMDRLSTSSDASRTAAPDVAEGERSTTPNQVSNVLRVERVDVPEDTRRLIAENLRIGRERND